MTRLYKESRQGFLNPQIATRLVFMLQNIAGLIKDSDLEDRIAALEATVKQGGAHGDPD